MAEANENGGATGQDQPSLSVVVQYVKDLSFENPNAPDSLRPRERAPTINVGINVNANPLSQTDFEVELRLEAKATDADKTVFAVELLYAGIFRIVNVPAEQMHPLVLIECPRLLFPFARQILAAASQNGGFPPLMLDPVDFAQLYRQRLAQQPASTQQRPS